MPNQAGRLDALSRGSTLPARAGMPSGFLDLEEALVAAEKIAQSGMVPRNYQNPAAVLRTGMKGQSMGIGFWEAIDLIDPIDNRPVPNAQCRLGHIRRRGHEAEFVFEECDRDKATIRGRRREDRNRPDGWKTVVYTIEEAEEAGLLDEWVERKYKLQGDKFDRTEKLVLRRTDTGYEPAQLGAEMPDWAATEVKAGRVKRKDNWYKARPAMLRARAASTLYRMHFSDLMFAADVDPYTAEEMGRDVGSDTDEPVDEDIVDAEIVEPEQGEDPGLTPEQMSAGVVKGATANASASSESTPTAADPIAEPEGVGDNGGAQVVGGSTAPSPPGPVDWRQLAKAHGVTVGGLLIRARTFAENRGLPAPASIEDVTDEQLVADVMDWLGEPA